MDRITRQHRSWNMSRIRSCDTKPEQLVRSIVHQLGFRFRKDSGKRLFGKPDIVLPRYTTVIFVHGCFWHRHAGCQLAYTPKSRISFWCAKFCANCARDEIVSQQLKKQGWKIVVIWECETEKIPRLKARLQKKLQRRRESVTKPIELRR